MKKDKKSPLEFFNRYKNKNKTEFRECDHPDCHEHAEYKAPKGKNNLNNYYWFCLKHVEEYNKSWNYYEGMSEIEVELDRRKSVYGNRPTWNNSHRNLDNDDLLNRVFNFGKDGEDFNKVNLKHHSEEIKALLELGLKPPVTFKEIKKRYRILVKKYHPDVNDSSHKHEKKIKKINAAYQILKKTYS